MHPQMYMKKFCVINERRRDLYSKLFRKYCAANKLISRKVSNVVGGGSVVKERNCVAEKNCVGFLYPRSPE